MGALSNEGFEGFESFWERLAPGPSDKKQQQEQQQNQPAQQAGAGQSTGAATVAAGKTTMDEIDVVVKKLVDSAIGGTEVAATAGCPRHSAVFLSLTISLGAPLFATQASAACVSLWSGAKGGI